MVFRRKRTNEPAPSPVAALLGIPAGEATVCNRFGCTSPADRRCGYIDRRNRPCNTDWCETHAHEIYGMVCCVRHTSTLVAIGSQGLDRGHLPELDNRVPSLVYWVGRDLEEDIPVMLKAVMDEQGGETMAADRVTLVAGGGRTAERRWERGWKNISHTGIGERITIQVIESSPTEVVVRVGGKLVHEETPPWIANRPTEPGLVRGDAEELNAAFYLRLREAIRGALRVTRH